MPVQAKICGLTTPETLAAALRHQASHVGFVFFAKSPRDLTPEKAGALAAMVPYHVCKVGVFVDPEPDFLAAVLRHAKLDAIQLHGDEPPEAVAALRDAHGVEVWKAIPVRTRADLERARGYRGSADRILYDARPPRGADLPGGLGLRFDWRLLARGSGGFVHPLPWALSGGLDAANVADAVGITGAGLVDVSSGVERAPGLKDVDKIAAFLQAVAQL